MTKLSIYCKPRVLSVLSHLRAKISKCTILSDKMSFLADLYRSQFPVASDILQRDFFVDDMLTSTHTVKEARSLIKDMTNLMNLSKFKLHKWVSNKARVLDKSLDTCNSKTITLENSVKTLGLHWHPSDDKFSINGPTISNLSQTKQTILCFPSVRSFRFVYLCNGQA